MQRLWFPAPFPGLNQALDIRGASRGKSNPWAAAKKKWHSTIGLLAANQGLEAFGPCCWTYLFVCKDRAMDKRNVSSIAAKLLEDGLKENGYIPNDGWKEVLDYRDHFVVGDPAGVHLFLGDRILALEECLEAIREEKAHSKPGVVLRER